MVDSVRVQAILRRPPKLCNRALAYEKEEGSVRCKQRENNFRKRAKGEYVRGERDISRPEFEASRDGQKELEKYSGAAPQNNPPAAVALRATMRRRMRAQLDAIKQQQPTWQGIYRWQQGEAESWRQQKASFVQPVRGSFEAGVKGAPLPCLFSKSAWKVLAMTKSSACKSSAANAPR